MRVKLYVFTDHYKVRGYNQAMSGVSRREGGGRARERQRVI